MDSVSEGSSGSIFSPNESDDVDCGDFRREKLDELLNACGKETLIDAPRKKWENLTNRRKKVYVSKATDAIVAVLDIITPGEAGNLWEGLQSTMSVEKALGIANQPPSDSKYLESLAEAYQNATSWDTRRQILSIMADLVPFPVIQKFIPDITEYRMKAARSHVLQYGRGTTVPISKSPRLKIDKTQLDHFLSFVTSSHVIQDLPFGQRYLRLTDGRVLETPNVIRSMIPQRIIQQYTQFCKEQGVKPLSPSTISRILTACGATTRKSLQGLDYYAADGGKGFDDLIDISRKLEAHGRKREWVVWCEKALKSGKQYLKADYKVIITNIIIM